MEVGCHVYISLWDDTTYLRDHVYDGMTVNDGEFDDVNFDPEAEPEEKYPLAKLRARILFLE